MADASKGIPAWLALMRTTQAMDRVARQSMDDVGLGFSDFVLLESLLHLGPLTPSQLSEKVGLTRGSITSAVDRLGARGLVEREPAEHDARSCTLRLTEAGGVVIQPAWETHSSDIERVMDAALAPDEQATLIRLLARVRRAARDEHGSTGQRSGSHA